MRQLREVIVRTREEIDQEMHSLPEGGKGRDFVSTQKQTDWVRSTHLLETADGVVGQDAERN